MSLNKTLYKLMTKLEMLTDEIKYLKKHIKVI